MSKLLYTFCSEDYNKLNICFYSCVLFNTVLTMCIVCNWLYFYCLCVLTYRNARMVKLQLDTVKYTVLQDTYFILVKL